MFSLSKTFNDTGNTYSGWSMERNPYIVRTCDAKDFDEDGTPYEAFSGIQATETFSIVHWATGAYASDGFTLAQVPFILAQRTNFLVNYKWPSDGVFPLGLQNQEMVSRILDSVGGKQEVTLWLNT
ncbi:hypothetical protein AAVH_21773 [Aphelenchoides avenae]|nr:hypothetical protein AAVH_21773 [Aphelenchus avenae]